MIITNSLGSNYSGEDIKLSLGLLFQPWKWQNGDELEKFRKLLTRDGSLRNFHVELFYKGRQAIGEALRILKIGTGDEVIVQAFTCVAVVQPILEAGATPIYVDVAPRRLNPPLSSIKAAATPKTKAVILQHTLGYVNPENEKIVSWCKQKGVAVIQDLAHSLGAFGSNKDSPSGTGRTVLNKSDAIILSFSQDKVVDGVSGGALISLSPVIPAKAGIYLNRFRVEPGMTTKEIIKLILYPLITYLIRSTYQFGVGGFTIGKGIHWLAKAIGLMNSPVEGNCIPVRMPNAMAALALNQFHRLDKISDHRRQIALLYNEALNSKLKIVSKDEISAGANLRYPIWVSPAKGGVNNRDELEEKLKKHGFYLVDHWYDAPVSPEWVDPKEVKYLPGLCPNAEELAKHIFNLPTHVNISNEKAVQLIKLVNQYAGNLKVRPWRTPRSDLWEQQLSRFPEANFLQSWEWGEFHRKLGHPVYRIIFDDGMFQGIIEPARRGRYLEIPGGPLLSNYSSLSLWKQAVSLMKQAAQKENCVFIRIRPQVSEPKVSDTLRTVGFRPAPMHLHAELTRVLDLTKTDEELLSQMRKSTRYEIRRALKLGIKVEQSDDENLLDEFVKLQAETAKREGFVPFAREYLLEQFRAFKKENAVSWFLLRPISMAFVIFYRGEAVYHYAASSDEARKIPAAYAIQWSIIQEARKRGCKTYNLWGDVADNQIGRHRFSGPSLFKRGFGGEQIAYLHARDLPLSWKYWINWWLETIRKKLRLL